MRCLVIGTGSIGQRHCRNLVALGHEVLAWDADPVRLHEASAIEGVSLASSLEAALATLPQAALICTPPVSHLRLAREAIAGGADVFVEKPIAHIIADELEMLLEETRRRERLLMVGCNLRFLPSLKHVKVLLDEKRVGKILSVRAEFGAYLPDWRPGRDYRENYGVRAALGGGILLDAIHELDYLVWFFGGVTEVFCNAGHLSDLAGDTEDLVEMTLHFDTGVLAQVHLDYVQRVYRRNLQVIGDGGTLLWDFPTHSVTVRAPDSDSAQEDFSTVEADRNQMYVDEIRHFAQCVCERKTPLVDGREALRSLRVVEAAKVSAREGRWVKL
jgi:predicted dehydrogenase